MMNFDEFRAVSERERLKKEEQLENASVKSNITAKSTRSARSTRSNLTKDKLTERDLLERIGETEKENDDDKTVKFDKKAESLGLGEFLEMHQMQAFVVGIIVLDTYASFAEIYLKDQKALLTFSSGGVIISPMTEIVVGALQSFTSFTIFFFVIEIIAVIIVFRSTVISHLGYVLDILVILLQLYLELVLGTGKITRMLNIFRLWRSVRLFNSIVNIEKDFHDKTKERFINKDSECRKLQIDVQRFTGDLIKEKEAKDAVEDMLATYKEEVDTLNEALKIAAMDIAEVAQGGDDYDSDDDEYNENEEDNEANEVDDEDSEFIDASSSDYDKIRNRDTLIHLARGSDRPSQDKPIGTTFVINDDGSYQRK
jgi:hypothetical protein